MALRTHALAVALLSSALSAAPAYGLCDQRADIRQDDQYAPLAIGDSVMLAAAKQLAAHGFSVDAQACRTYAQGLEIILQRRLPDLLVVALGSNASVAAAQVRETVEAVGPFGRVIFVLPRALGGGPDPDGQVMRAAASAYPDQVEVLDWPAYSEGEPGWLAGDGLHLTGAGAQAFAAFIADAPPVEAAEPLEPAPRKPEPQTRRPRRASLPADGHPAVAALWRGVGRALATWIEPALRLLGQLVRVEASEPQDL